METLTSPNNKKKREEELLTEMELLKNLLRESEERERVLQESNTSLLQQVSNQQSQIDALRYMIECHRRMQEETNYPQKSGQQVDQPSSDVQQQTISLNSKSISNPFILSDTNEEEGVEELVRVLKRDNNISSFSFKSMYIFTFSLSILSLLL